MGLLILKIFVVLCCAGVVVYCLIRLYHDDSYKLLEKQIELIKERDADSYYHYRCACSKGVVMVSDVEYAYLVDKNIIQNDIYYCRYITDRGKIDDSLKVGSCSLWFNGKPIFSDLVYPRLMNDLKNNHVFITAKAMSETLKIGLTAWLTDIEEERLEK